jgi:hypothetical protein
LARENISTRISPFISFVVALIDELVCWGSLWLFLGRRFFPGKSMLGAYPSKW